jgi:collagen type I alpha
VNEGTITAATGAGVALAQGGTVENFNVLASGGSGVRAGGAAQVINNGKLVAGTGPGVALAAGGAVLNDWAILSTGGVAVSIAGGGTVASDGTISGGSAGVVFTGGAGTVIDSGTIAAGSGAPVVFAVGYANVLTVSDGATFSGTVDGANAIGAPVASTLVLADLATYVFTRTPPVYNTAFYGYGSVITTVGGYQGPPAFSGLGTRFTNFATIVNDANWIFDGTDAIAAGATLMNTQLIEGGGVTLGRGSVLVNSHPGANSGLLGGGIRYGTNAYVAGQPSLASHAVYAGAGSPGVTIVNELGINDQHNLGMGIVLMAGGTVRNAAAVAGYSVGISAAGPATIVNEGLAAHASAGSTYWTTGVIEGAVGMTASGLATIDNAGVIAGSSAAVLLAAGYADRVVVRPGAVFDGRVDGGNAAGAAVDSTLELAAGMGTLAGLGTQFTNFGAVAVDTGATWTLSGGASLAAGATLGVAGTLVLAGGLSGGGVVALEPGGEIVFAPGEAPAGVAIGGAGTIEVLGAAENVAGYGAGVLTLGGALGVTLDVAGTHRISDFAVRQAAGNTYVTACFAGGTRLLTEAGPRGVEALRPGMRVVTAGGRLAPVRWIGRRRLAPGRHVRPWDVMPVRVRAGAFGDGVPARDLVLSPDHAVLAGGVLIPVRYLINGDTIAQETRAEVTYWHVELDRHDVVLAEGLACESYLDTGNRCAFEGGEALALHPDFAGAEGCLTLVLDTADARMVEARAALLARAAPVVDEAEIRLDAGGMMLRPRDEGGCLVFELPEGGARAVLRSRVFVPAHARAESDDTRTLGVAVEAVWRDGEALALSALCDGWRAMEPGHRWTDGAGVIPLGGARRLVVRLGPAGFYRVTERAAGRRRRRPGRAAAVG